MNEVESLTLFYNVFTAFNIIQEKCSLAKSMEWLTFLYSRSISSGLRYLQLSVMPIKHCHQQRVSHPSIINKSVLRDSQIFSPKRESQKPFYPLGFTVGRNTAGSGDTIVPSSIVYIRTQTKPKFPYTASGQSI